MQVIRGIEALAQALDKPTVTIGNFDGVHLGHQEILQQVKKQAQAIGGQTVVFTFRPHPQVALRPGAQVPMLTTYDEKLELLGQQGIDFTIEEPFSRTFSTIDAESFFTDILLKRLGARAVVVGYDFKFGKERGGHLEALDKLCKRGGVNLTVVPPLRTEGEIASSTRIRQALSAGEIEKANRLLGRPFFYRDIVIKGEQRGRMLGFPTANLKIHGKIVLPFGVYVTESGVLGKQMFRSVTNVGIRPTFEGAKEPLVETHLIEQDVDLYGSQLEVRFLKFLRPEKKFAGMAELIKQIKSDLVIAREFSA